MVARGVHNPKVVGSNPTPATKIKNMCAIFEEDYIRIGEAIHHFIITAKASEIKDVEGELKDYLSDLKDAGKISHCGCGSRAFKVEKEGDSYLVFMEIFRCIIKYIITNEGFTRTNGSWSDVIDNYDGWQETLEKI